MKRTETRSIQVRDITIGGQNKVVIQSMCNTRTSDIEGHRGTDFTAGAGWL